MGLFSKKEDVPTIPKAEALPDLPKVERVAERELPELPSFPSNSKNDTMNQEIVKSAISDIPHADENSSMPEIPKVTSQEVKPEFPSLPSRPVEPVSQVPQAPTPTPKVEEPIISNPPKRSLELTGNEAPEKPSTKQSEPIFVRIDKFQASQKNFEQIKDKVKEIESLLKRIKDIKEQEETEVKSWSDDVEKIKSRLSQIDADIFSQL